MILLVINFLIFEGNLVLFHFNALHFLDVTFK